MKHIIYYFSGTGNSMRTAARIAEKIGGAKIVSVRCDPEMESAETAAVIGFVCPVYEWDIPGTMREFVRKLKINPEAYIFMIATYIAIHGKAFETMETIIQTKDASAVRHVSGYVPQKILPCRITSLSGTTAVMGATPASPTVRQKRFNSKNRRLTGS